MGEIGLLDAIERVWESCAFYLSGKDCLLRWRLDLEGSWRGWRRSWGGVGRLGACGYCVG